VGELRFKAPQELDAWTGVYEAATIPYASMQNPNQNTFYKQEFHTNSENYDRPFGEDSLYMNIWTPANAPEDKLPVALWIHGGAYMEGHATEVEYDGAAYARRGVILVTIQYRLNVFGFLAHPWLVAEDKNGTAGNYGMLDQIAALNWVYDNIAAFGGDPKRITLMGQSAGAMSVQSLVSSPLTQGKIAGAIMQSGGGYENGLLTNMTLEKACLIGERFVARTHAKSLQELRQLSAEKLLESLTLFMRELYDPQKDFELVFQPNIDGYVLMNGYDALVRNGVLPRIPYLLGSNKNDIIVSPTDDSEGEESRLYAGCKKFSYQLENLQQNPAYVYFFTRDLPGDDVGAFHSAELWYMFGTWSRCWRPFSKADEALSERMLDAWASFVKNGNPSCASVENWRRCTQKDPYIMRFDI
jgi:para-nitrobenzyl esterase